MKTKTKSLKKNCIISAVGNNSLHREWIKEDSNFDLHLIVYDDSFEKFHKDTAFICHQKGYKLRLVYHYLQKNPEYLEQYDYFFLPDDDIQMDTANISKLFQLMESYQLQIAQPGLSNSYYTYQHLLRDKLCLLRYTTFVEMMLPCFSREALKKVLPHFDANNSGWGIDLHWPRLISFTGTEMAIIDGIYAVHTRPVQSYNPKNHKEYDEYITMHNLKLILRETGSIPIHPEESKSKRLIQDRKSYKFIEHLSYSIAEQLIQMIRSTTISPTGFEGATNASLFLIHYSRISEKRKYHDTAIAILEMISDRLGWLKEDLSFNKGLPGFSWYIEHLAQHGFIENDTDETLEDVCKYLNDFVAEEITDSGLYQLLEIIPHYIARITNPHFETDTKLHSQEKQLLTSILQRINKWSHSLSVEQKNIDVATLTKSILLLYQAKKVSNLSEIDFTLQKLILILEDLSPETQLPYLLKTYLLILSSENSNNELLKNQMIHEAEFNKDYCRDTGFQQLLNLYLLYQIYLKTKKDFFRTRALEILDSFIEHCQKRNDPLTYLTNDLSLQKGNAIEIHHFIRIGLILITILSEKDTELELCIL